MRFFTILYGCLAVLPAASQLAAAEKIDFRREVLPILADKCFACHGRDAAHREGKLLFARDCYEKAGDAAKATAVREEWLKIFPTPPPPPTPQAT